MTQAHELQSDQSSEQEYAEHVPVEVVTACMNCLAELLPGGSLNPIEKTNQLIDVPQKHPSLLKRAISSITKS